MQPQPHSDDKRKQDDQHGLEDRNVTRPAPIDREPPPARPEPPGLEDRNITRPSR